MSQNNFFRQKLIGGIKKRKILCWFQICWYGFGKMFRKTVICNNSNIFCLYLLYRKFFKHTL